MLGSAGKMLSEAYSLVECFTASITLEWFVHRVNVAVFLQMVLPFKSFTANLQETYSSYGQCYFTAQ